MTTVPIPRSVKTRSTYRRAGPATSRAAHDLGHPGERCSELVEPRPGLRADGDDLGSGNELACLLERDRERLLVDQVGLRHSYDTCLDAEQAQDREVLERLWARSFGRVDHEQEQVDPRRACHHRAHEALVPGHVDQREPTPVGQLERGVAEVDRDPPPPLLGQAVRVLAR